MLRGSLGLLGIRLAFGNSGTSTPNGFRRLFKPTASATRIAWNGSKLASASQSCWGIYWFRCWWCRALSTSALWNFKLKNSWKRGRSVGEQKPFINVAYLISFSFFRVRLLVRTWTCASAAKLSIDPTHVKAGWLKKERGCNSVL